MDASYFESEEFRQLQEEVQNATQLQLEESLDCWSKLDSHIKYKMVEAMLHIICESEKEGCSHRQLMDNLGIYPEGFWISELMDVHNALYTLYNTEESS